MTGNLKKITADTNSILSSVRAARKDLADGIATLRDHIKKLKEQRDEVLSIGVTQEFANTRVEEWIDGIVDRAARLTMGKYLLPPDPAALLKSPTTWSPPETDLLLLIGICLKDDLSASMKSNIAALFKNGRDQITEDDRNERRSEIERNLLDAELGEESIIRAAEKSGFKVLRRADADPRAVMASNADLP